MASRMDRYYKPENDTKKRVQKNEQLYKDIYDNVSYSNIEGVATIQKGSEIDINKVKNMLKNREDYQNIKQSNEVIRKPIEKEIEKEEIVLEEKSYDIRDILSKAKEENKKEEYHTLSDTNYDIFKDLRNKRRKEIEKEGITENGLRELIDTLTSTSVIKNMEDDELSLDLLDDLKSTKEKEESSIKNILEQAKLEEKIKEEKELKEKEKEKIDESFYTSSFNLKEKDFEDFLPTKKEKKQNNILKKSILFIILILIAFAIVYFVFNMLK